MARARRIAATVGLLCVVGAASATGVFAFGDRTGEAVVPAPPEAGGAAPCEVPDVDGADTRWIVSPQAQRAKDVIDEELKERFGEGSEESGPRGRLERGLIGIANDHLARQVVVITDPGADIDETELEDELHRLTGSYQQSHPGTRKLGVRVQEGCHRAADLIEAYEVLRARDWHPRADETPGTSGLSSYDSTYHVSLPTDAREVGEALQARLGPVITLTYTDDWPTTASAPKADTGAAAPVVPAART